MDENFVIAEGRRQSMGKGEIKIAKGPGDDDQNTKVVHDLGFWREKKKNLPEKRGGRVPGGAIHGVTLRTGRSGELEPSSRL